MASQVAWGQRKALGRRYSTDPALLLEQDRMNYEYSLTPQREARALQASQFDRSLALQEENAKAAGKAGYIQAAVNLGTTAAMAYYLKTKAIPPTTPSVPASSPGLSTAPTTTAPQYEPGPWSPGPETTAPQTTSPALTDVPITEAAGPGSVGTAAGATSAIPAADVGLAGGGAGEAATYGMGGSGASGSGAMGSAATSQPYGLYYAAGHYAGKALNEGPVEKNWGSNEYPLMSPVASMHRGPGRIVGSNRGEALSQKMEGPEQALWGERRWDNTMWREVFNPRLEPLSNYANQFLGDDAGTAVSVITNPVGAVLDLLGW